jgi:hypothetical protein
MHLIEGAFSGLDEVRRVLRVGNRLFQSHNLGAQVFRANQARWVVGTAVDAKSRSQFLNRSSEAVGRTLDIAQRVQR